MSEQPSSAHWQLHSIVSGLRSAREQWRSRNGRSIGEQGGRELPSREAIRQVLEQLCGALFPMRLGPVDLREESEDFYVGHTLDAALTALLAQARLELRYAARQSNADLAAVDAQALRLIQDFAAALPGLRVLLDTDVLAAYHGGLGPNPALSLAEVREGVRRQSFFGVMMSIVSSMLVVQTQRGDQMFMTMLDRHSSHVLDTDALDVLPSAL